ncbi:MAG: CoA-binding protein [Planctomycetota bacterium]|nr:CoA-binding protein [Planctomycetota bacterium]
MARGDVHEVAKDLENMQDRIQDFLSTKSIALVGATPRTHKWGYKVFRCLIGHGYETHPIHPIAVSIDGVPCKRRLADVGLPIDGVSVVVPPAQGVEVCEEARSLNISRVWFQPGAESKEAIEYCEAQGIAVIHNACVLRELGC